MREERFDPPDWPVTVGCVSDTHIPGRARSLPRALLDGLAGADLILHAGDLVSADVLLELEALAPTVAVAGNVDPPELAERLGPAVVVGVGGWRVALVHGHLGRGANTPERALASVRRARPHVLVFGHSHRPLCGFKDGVLLLNPGSPTDPRLAPWPSYGLLVLPRPGPGARPHGEVVKLGDGDSAAPGLG